MVAISEPKFRLIIELAKKQGWKVEQTKNSHWKLCPPVGRGTPVFVASTPGDHRWLDNVIRELRRRGLTLPHKGGK